jgi:site-specific DNA-methyltransferase (adenine-specific)
VTDVVTGDGWELRRGRWQDVLADVTGDALISDPPYSKRTHKGHDACETRRNDGANAATIDFDSWTADDAREYSESWSERVRGWLVTMTDHILFPVFEATLAERGRYVFAPVVFMARGSRVRLQGDGPASWSTHICTARHRTKEAASWGALPGGYVLPKGYDDLKHGAKLGVAIAGGKPLWIMQELIRDYTRRGDIVVDPCAGAGTTLLAAIIEGRRAIGAEMNDERFELAARRLAKPYTQTLDF